MVGRQAEMFVSSLIEIYPMAMLITENNVGYTVLAKVAVTAMPSVRLD